MYQVYIWGAGHCAQQVIEEIDEAHVNIVGIVDGDKDKQGKDTFYPLQIFPPSELYGKNFDYLIISVKNYSQIEQECENFGIEHNKVIAYWKENIDNLIFKIRSKRVEQLMIEKNIFQYRLDSAPYEWGIKEVPRIIEGKELLKKIISDHSSLCRFGDGEFELIRGNERPWFQKPDEVLGNRLKEVLSSNNDLINIAVAQNFVGLEQYKDKDADAIREYMYGDTRREIIRLLDMGRLYYDTYVTRPYIIYKNRKNADEIFPLFKKIWKDRDVFLIEGKYARTGVGNDLLACTHSLHRILCPPKNAWGKYEEILNAALYSIPKEALVCLSLGPCATVLAYDLAQQGYQALDIGQLDNEYEWYLRQADERVEIPGKMVSEVSGECFPQEIEDREYSSQIVAIID